MYMQRRLRAHQLAAVERLRSQRGLVLAHSLGSGKTVTAVAAAADYLLRNPQHRVVVVTPKSLQENFAAEVGRQLEDASAVTYHTFESFARSAEFCEERRGRACARTMLVIDEAHNLRTTVSQTSGSRPRALVECARRARRVLLLTATPFVNSVYDVANLVAMVDGTRPLTRTQFAAVLESKPAFHEYFAGKFDFYAPSARDRLRDYPEIVENEVFLPMTPAYLREYEKVERAVGHLDLFANPAVFYNGVRRASNALDDASKSQKLQWLLRFLRRADGKIIVFSNWLAHGLELATKLLADLGVVAAHVDGSLSKRRRAEAVRLYNEGAVRALLISRAGGEGLDLHETAHMVLLDPGWNQALVDQVVGRGVRYKSHAALPEHMRTVHVHKLYLCKPGEKKNEYFSNVDNVLRSRKPWSIDVYMRALAIQKAAAIKSLISKIKRLK